MKSLQDLFDKKRDAIKDYLKPEDKKIIDEIHFLVNRDRVWPSLYKKVPWIAVKMKLYKRGMNVYEMEELLKKMRKSSEPGKVFFGITKKK